MSEKLSDINQEKVLNESNFEGEKAILENKKLSLEIEELRKPFYRKPGMYVSVFTLIAAVLGIGFQWMLSTHKYELAQIEAEKADLKLLIARKETREAVEAKEKAVKELNVTSKSLKKMKDSSKIGFVL